MDGSRAIPNYVTLGQSNASDPVTAVAEATAGIDLNECRFVLVFVPCGLSLDTLGPALEAAMNGVPVFGCTTAGQITGDGYETDALLLVAFPKAHFRCASVLFHPLKPISIPDIAAVAERHAAQFRHTASWNRLALILADGVTKQEDLLVSTLEMVLGDLPVFGGSAADGLAFRETHVLHGGQFHRNAALLLLLETDLNYEGLEFDHFLPTDTQLVITDADPEERLVFEINGAPAAQEYARLVGCSVDDLCPRIFAENPLLVQHGKRHYVRAISDASDNQALSFLAAIDDGLIMTLGRGKAVVETLETGLDVCDKSGDAPDFILGFDCVLRRLEIEEKQLSRPVSDVLQNRRVFGFNTYGEQHCGVHMNQTFVGVAFFGPEGRSLA